MILLCCWLLFSSDVMFIFRCCFSRFSIVVFILVIIWIVVCKLNVCKLCLLVLWLVKVLCISVRMFLYLFSVLFIISGIVFFSVLWIFLLLGIFFMLVWLELFLIIIILCVKNGVCVLFRFISILLWFVIGIICILVIIGVVNWEFIFMFFFRINDGWKWDVYG